MSQIRELEDHEIDQVSGGFLKFFVKLIVGVVVNTIACRIIHNMKFCIRVSTRRRNYPDGLNIDSDAPKQHQN